MAHMTASTLPKAWAPMHDAELFSQKMENGPNFYWPLAL